MADVEQVEAAVGEDDRLARLAPAADLGGELLPVEDLRALGRWWSSRSRRISSRVSERDADLLDLQAAGDVPERGGLVVVGARGQAEADDREHHVAGAGDVVDLPRPGRQQLGAAVGADQGHAVAVERDEDGLHLERLDQLPADREARRRACAIVSPVASWASSRFGVMQWTPRYRE